MKEDARYFYFPRKKDMTKELLLTLIEEKKFSEIRENYSHMLPADMAELLSELDGDELLLPFRLLPKEVAADTFAYMDTDDMESLLTAFSDKELSRLIDELFIDDAVDIIEEMPANVAERLLSRATPEMRREINMLLQYPAESVGSIMTTEFVRLYPDMTVREAFDKIRETGIDKEIVYTSYVTDKRRVLVGVVTALMLLTADLDAKIGYIMEENVISVGTLDDKEFAANQLSKYDFLALPVVDSENRMVGIVNGDDAIDVITEEYSEDMDIMAAITPTDKPYLQDSVITIWLHRIPWLLLLMLSATFTGMIISSFESALAAEVTLTAFIPMLMGTGGNSGSQSSTTVIRGLSLDEIDFSDTFAVIWKEIRISVLCGITLAIASFVKILTVDNLLLGSGISVYVAAVVSVTLLFTVISAKVIGAIMPLLAKKCKFDPAVMASPFITTAVDALSLLLYFLFASMILGI